jgi:hypothetical protein
MDYTSNMVSIIQLPGDPRTDTISTTIDYTVALHRLSGTSARVSGTLERFTITPLPAADSSGPRTHVPLSFVSRLTAGGLSLDSAAGQAISTSTTCSPALGVLTSLQRSLLLAPPELNSEMTWRDSTTIRGCNGLLPSSVTLIRTFRVKGENTFSGRRSIVVERADTTITSGEGSQGQHRIFISTVGSGLTTIHLDRTTGLLLGADGAQATQVQVRSSGRVQEFRQATCETVSVRR